jgi:hypothetical protein
MYGNIIIKLLLQLTYANNAKVSFGAIRGEGRKNVRY